MGQPLLFPDLVAEVRRALGETGFDIYTYVPPKHLKEKRPLNWYVAVKPGTTYDRVFIVRPYTKDGVVRKVCIQPLNRGFLEPDERVLLKATNGWQHNQIIIQDQPYNSGRRKRPVTDWRDIVRKEEIMPDIR